MQEIIQQVGELLLGSIPTLILFIVLVLAYQFLVQGPLSRTLAERRARTSGAVENANKAIAAADAKAEEYADKLRHARAEVFRVREQRLQQWAHERDTVLDAARKKAVQRVLEAKVALEAEAGVARKTLLAGADQLAEQVIRAVMPATAGGSR
jgi:F-type H+-transporting ATPase subunit b